MSLDPLKIALSGFGGGVLAIALSGFVMVAVEPPPVVVQPPIVSESGGSARIKAQQAARRALERAERERILREEDEAVILAIAAFVTGESG